ncbi:GMC oxidoreductase [Purpureocillium lavendulum]|uniref:GMC oxidoreductase n=1 Tax=Purpureocillium lavendulum TaxID=1247861 RepID=A0AB34FXJ6_9HYPO|nr:GMC oxidoreductase [Purpureocillium lavendulum]
MGIFTCSRKSRANPPQSMGDWKSESPPEYKQAIASDHASSYSSSPGGFLATSELQVEAIGYDTNQALSGSKLENISVYSVESGAPAHEKYTSIRLKTNSNSCALVQSSDPSQSALISTIYRWGPGRHPRMRILPRDAGVSVEQAIDDDKLRGESIDVKSRSMVSRAQVFDTSLGKFEWRYGSREEKDACNADSLLILERTDRSVRPDGTKTKSGARIAQLVRNDQFRTPGSVRYSGGNGGRLVMDLRMWEDEKHAGADAVEAFVVASCILMLKREADRFIDNNIAAVV